MSEITGGRASFRRVVQVAPYEVAEAMLEYSFTVEPGEDAGQKGAETLALAKRQVLVSVGKAKAAEPAPEAAVKDPEKKPRGKAKAAAKAEKKESPPAVLSGDEDEVPAEEPKEDEDTKISDADLQEAAKKAAQKVTGRVVRAYLAEKFNCQQLSKLAQKDRAKFIAGLDKLKKPS